MWAKKEVKKINAIKKARLENPAECHENGVNRKALIVLYSSDAVNAWKKSVSVRRQFYPLIRELFRGNFFITLGRYIFKHYRIKQQRHFLQKILRDQFVYLPGIKVLQVNMRNQPYGVD